MHTHSKNISIQKMYVVITITFTFALIELYGSWLSHSLALASDGVHMLTDIGSMLISLLALWLSKKPMTLKMSFGYQRAEILAALFSGLCIWIISVLLIYESALRISSPQVVQGPTVLIIAGLGMFGNLISMKCLHPLKAHNMNLEATYLHLLSDLLGNLGTVCAGIILWWTQWQLIDTLVTILFSCIMIISTWKLIQNSIRILMESAPPSIDPLQIKNHLLQLQSVQEIHDLHIWSLTQEHYALSAHLVSRHPTGLLKQATELLKNFYHIHHATLQIEKPHEIESIHCYDCKPIEKKTQTCEKC